MNTPIIDFYLGLEDSGEWRTDVRRGYVNPAKCTGFNDLINTIQHEQIHQILSDELGTTTDQDHFAIDIIDYCDFYF